MTGRAAYGRRWIAVSVALATAITSALAAACEAPKHAPRDEGFSTPREKPRDDRAIVDAASKLADEGDYEAAHATLQTLPSSSDALDDPRVARIEAGWAEALFERVTRGGLADGGRADLERIAAAPRIPSDTRRRALEMLSRPSAEPNPTPSAAPAPSGPSVRIGTGGWNVGDVEVVLTNLSSKFRGCYDVELALDPTLKGAVRLEAKIGPTGDVLGAASSPSSLPKRMLDCLKTVLFAAPFSPPEGGGATVVVPLTFTPAP